MPRRYAPRNDERVVLALTAVVLAVCFARPAHAAEPQTVVIDNFSFKPNVVTVAPGTHIVFKNHDDLPHTVVIPGMQVKSPMMDTDGTYEASFDKPGTTLASTVIYPWYTEGAHGWGIRPMDDQVLGGLLMWIGQGTYLMFVFTFIFYRWSRLDDRDVPTLALSPRSEIRVVART